MNTIIFNGTKGFSLTYAGDYNSRCECTHITCFKNDELERIGEQYGLEFHYELHFSEKEKFIRFCCHIREYHKHKNYKRKEDMRQKLAAEDKEHLIAIRRALANAFKNDFADVDCIYIAKKFNYLGLIRRNINADDYSGAIAESESFIVDTFERALKTIVSTISDNQA